MELIEIANILAESGILVIVSLTAVSKTQYSFLSEDGCTGTIDTINEEVIIHSKNKIKCSNQIMQKN